MLGERIRRRRQELGLSLRELASKVDLTASFLSQIERDLASPSLKSLRKTAEALQVPIFHFLNESDLQSPVVRRDARKTLTLPHSDLTYQLLTPDVNHKIEMFLAELKPGQRNIAMPLPQPTEECIFVLQGKMRVRLDDTDYELVPGDSVYFEGQRLREISAVGEEKLAFISVITPAVF
jgi:transcriptional regulator with XRE-family HTH domain